MNRRDFIKRAGMLAVVFCTPSYISLGVDKYSAPWADDAYLLNDFSTTFIQPAAKALANKMDEELIRAYKQFYPQKGQILTIGA